MDLELATNLIFEGACCGRQGLLSRRPKAVGGPLHSNCAAMPPPHQQLQSTAQGGCLRLTVVANEFLWLLLLLAAAPAYCEPAARRSWGMPELFRRRRTR